MKKVLLFLALVFCASTAAHAQLAKVQAGFIYNFTNYMEWQQDDLGESFVIGVFGNSTTTDALRMLEGNKTIKNKPVFVKTYATIGEVGKCQILYLPKDRANSLAAIFSRDSV